MKKDKKDQRHSIPDFVNRCKLAEELLKNPHFFSFMLRAAHAFCRAMESITGEDSSGSITDPLFIESVRRGVSLLAMSYERKRLERLLEYYRQEELREVAKLKDGLASPPSTQPKVTPPKPNPNRKFL